MKKILLSVVIMLSLVGTAYAGCFTTANFSPSTIDANAQKLALQCFAMRSGGSWSIAANGLSATKSGGSTYSAMTPWFDGSHNRLDLIQNGVGSHVVQVTYDSAGSMSFYLPSAPTEHGVCSLYFTLNGIAILDGANAYGAIPRVKYCR